MVVVVSDKGGLSQEQRAERVINSLTERGAIVYVEGRGYELATEEKGVSV